MRIVHCLIHYLPEYVAGTEIYTHTLARMLQESGNEVSVVTPHIDFHHPGEMRGHYVHDGINVYQYLETADPNNRDYYNGSKQTEGLSHFSALLDRLQPDIVHFHQLNQGVGLSIEHVKVARSKGAKTFVTMHLSFYTCNTNLLINRNRLCDGNIGPIICSACTLNQTYKLPYGLATCIARIGMFTGKTGLRRLPRTSRLQTMLSFPELIRRKQTDLLELARIADRLICIAAWYKDILLKNGVPENKLILIPQALADSTERFNLQEDQHEAALPLRLVFIGRIQWQKGLHLLIDACSRFTGKEISLEIYGQKEDTEYCRSCISASSGKEHIRWKGSIGRSDIIATLSRYNLLCLPSVFSEMSPLVIQEAFRARVPVLASRVYGNMEQIRDGENGMLFEFNSADDLASRIGELIQDPVRIRKMKESIRQPEHFSGLVKKHLALYGTC